MFLKRIKKQAIYLVWLISIFCCTKSFGQTPNTNYIRIRMPQIAVKDTAKLDTVPVQRMAVMVQYQDALGRASQKIQLQASPNQMDVIIPYTYDNMGRSVKAYLPYVDESTTSTKIGTLRSNAFTNAVSFYNPAAPGALKMATDSAPYIQTVFERSPLGRVNEQGALGTVFQPGTGHTARTSYNINLSNDGIAYYPVTNGTLSVVSLYNQSVLTKTVLTDGNGHRTAIWKDLQGKEISRSQLDAPSLYYSTDYIYNDLNQLINVITPAGKKQLSNPGSSFQTILAQQSYTFRYDSIGRLVEKKIPGKGWVYAIYNHSDHQVLSQDSNMRAKNQWLFTKYDAEGRMVQIGLYINTTVISRKSMQAFCDHNFTTLWETWQPGVGYTNSAFPQQSAIPASTPLIVYSENYYDDYSFTAADGKPFKANLFNTVATQRTMGMLTGSSVCVLGTSNQRMVTVNYYDQQNRLIQQQADNHLGQVNIINSQYDYLGRVKRSQRITTAIAGSPITVRDSFVYDHFNRLTDTYESFQGGAKIDISHNVYNEIGQKVSEGLHSTNYTGPGSTGYTFAQTQEFRYNIRTELSSINNGTLTYDSGLTQSDPNALFGESISYSGSSPINATPQYNGNISGVMWRNKIEQTGLTGLTTGGQGYAFTYDNVNRLTQSNYFTQAGSNSFAQSTTGAFTEKVKAYDELGNIDTLQRRDKNGNLLNNLAYNYSNGNQISSISDVGSQNIGGTFTYDGNGNMTSDSRKGIILTYNLFDLVDTVKQGNNKLIFTYDGHGHKLYKQLISSSGGVISQRHYIDKVEVTASSSIAFDGKVDNIKMDEGRIINNGSNSFQYEYYLQDHLYSNRVTFRPNADGTINLGSVQNLYPLGADMGDATMNYSASPQNLYIYEGKEENPELGLNNYDFGARNYDPILGRWNSIDPLAENFGDLSPYNYVENNPLNLTDPDGMQPLGTIPQVDPYVSGAQKSSGVVSKSGFGLSGWAGVGSSAVFQFIAGNNAFSPKVSFTDWNRLSSVERIRINANQGGDDPYLRSVAAQMTREWYYGTGPSNRLFYNDVVAKALQYSHGANAARTYFYNKYKNTKDLSNASVVNFDASFGIHGLVRAGLNPIQQFVGSFKVSIYTSGNNLMFSVYNVTSWESFTDGFGSNWERTENPRMGNTYQNYIWFEPIKDHK